MRTSDTSSDVPRLTIGTSGGVGTDANASLLNVKLGIGTATPNVRLQVYEGGESTTLANLTQALTVAGVNVVTDYTAGAYGPGLFWSTTNDNPTKPKAGIWLLEDGGGSRILFGTSNSYVTGITNTALSLNASGYVGMGTAAPDAYLHLSAATTSLLHLQSTTGGAGNTANLDFTTYGDPSGRVARISAQDEGTFDGSLRFYTDGDGVNNSNVTEKMRITPAGNVYLLNSDLYFTKTDHTYTGIGDTAGYAAIENSSNYNTLMIMGRSGGIGGVRSVSCWDRFDLHGLLVATGNNTQTSAIIKAFDGSYLADWPGGWGGGLATWDMCVGGVRYSVLTPRSDRRLKQNVVPLEDALIRLQRLRPVSYVWKDPRLGGDRHYGFIAQEVEEAIPDLVRGTGDEMKSLNQQEIIAFLVRGTQELEEALRRKRETRKALEARLEALEKALDQRSSPLRVEDHGTGRALPGESGGRSASGCVVASFPGCGR